MFVSDRVRNNQPHLYPQLDEYEEAPTNTGLWNLNPLTGDLYLMNHAPSGAFKTVPWRRFARHIALFIPKARTVHPYPNQRWRV